MTTYHPVTALFRSVGHNVNMDRPGGLIIACLDGM